MPGIVVNAYECCRDWIGNNMSLLPNTYPTSPGTASEAPAGSGGILFTVSGVGCVEVPIDIIHVTPDQGMSEPPQATSNNYCYPVYWPASGRSVF